MLALIYFALSFCVGDFVCRRFYQFESVAHRCAAAILVGLLVNSWFTSLAGLAFPGVTTARLGQSFVLHRSDRGAVLAQVENQNVKRGSAKVHEARSDLYLSRPKGSGIADWMLIAGYVVLVSSIMFASFNTKGGKLQIANPGTAISAQTLPSCKALP